MPIRAREIERKRRHKRVRRKVTGTAQRPRFNVYRSLQNTYAQIIDDESGRTLVQASTVDPELRKSVAGIAKVEQADAVGAAVADRAKKQGITQVVFDRGGYKYHGRVRALAEAARQHGLQF